MSGALNIDISTICLDMIDSSKKWFHEVKDTENFKRNYESFMVFAESLNIKGLASGMLSNKKPL
jgi:hypothetical protein